MKKKILIVSLLLVVGTAVAVFAASRCKSDYKYYADSWSKAEWVSCELDDGHQTKRHEGRASNGRTVYWWD